MSLFHLGQHVKVVQHCEGSTYHVGKTGFVDELDTTASDGTPGMTGVELGDGGDWCFYEWQLEPVQRDGDANRVVDMEKTFPGLLGRCLTGVTETA